MFIIESSLNGRPHYLIHTDRVHFAYTPVRAGVVRAVYDTKVYDDGSPDRRFRYYCVNLVQIVKINHVTAQLAAIYDEAE